MLEPFVTMWIGPRLGLVERACLRSVLRQGHSVALYSYRAVDGVPEGVEVRDAAEILPEDKVLRHRSGSVALFSNWFRYMLQRLGRGIWIDTDHYLLAPVSSAGGYVFGWQDYSRVGNGILRLPADSPVLAPLLALFEQREVPFWLSPPQRLLAHARLLKTGRTGLEEMPWGSAGPNATTALLRRHRLLAEAADRAVHYPVHYSDADWVRDPLRSLESRITPATVGLHLWNERIKTWKEEPPPPGSFLARLHREGR